jgi:hypothetical protein
MTGDARIDEAAGLDARVDALRARYADHASLPLGFAVFGVPRSGTTAVARYLNAHRGVICLHERFDPALAHNGLRFPGALFDAPWGGEANRKENLVRFVGEETGPVTLWGAKTPRYYLRLARVMAGVPSGRGVHCYRRPEEVAQSYNDRAANPRDHWRAQLKGLFGVLELPICIARMLSVPGDFLTVPHRAIREDARGAAAAILGFLAPGAAAAADDGAFAAADEIGASRLDRPRAPLAEVEQEACALIGAERIDAILSGPRPRRFAEVADAARDWLAALPPDLVRRGAEMAQAYGPQVAAYARDTWAPDVRPAWQEAHRAAAPTRHSPGAPRRSTFQRTGE